MTLVVAEMGKAIIWLYSIVMKQPEPENIITKQLKNTLRRNEKLINQINAINKINSR